MTRFVATFRNLQPGGLFLESNECFERVLQIFSTLDAVGVNLRVGAGPRSAAGRSSAIEVYLAPEPVNTSVHNCGEDQCTELLQLFMCGDYCGLGTVKSQWVPWDLYKQGQRLHLCFDTCSKLSFLERKKLKSFLQLFCFLILNGQFLSIVNFPLQNVLIHIKYLKGSIKAYIYIPTLFGPNVHQGPAETFQISPHLSSINLKFLHMTDFSPQIFGWYW